MTRNFQEIHIEQDFWDDFIVEAFEHIDAIESNAMSLEQNPENMDIIHTMFRAFHTIKGLSGFVEHTIIQEVAHKTETMMDLCRKGELKVNTEIVNAILKSSDFIKHLCDDINAYKEEILISDIEKHLDVLEHLSNINWEIPPVDQSQHPAEQPQETVELKENIEHQENNECVSQENHNEDFEPDNNEQEQYQGETQQANESPEENNASQDFNQDVSQPQETSQEDNIAPQENVEQNIEHGESGLEAFAQEISEVEKETEDNEYSVETENNSDNQIFEQQEHTEISFEIPINETEAIKTEEVATGQTEEEVSKELTVEEKALNSFRTEIMQKLKNTSTAQNEDSSATKHTSANEEYMKVANYKIDHLVDMMGELIINQAQIERYVTMNYDDDRELVTNMSGFLRITRELQNLSMSLRMVALKPTFQKLTRVARDTIQELNKNVEFVTSGENTEIDRVVADKLLDPLVHMIKNAISHGIEENNDDRINAGKNARAKVELNAYSKRGKIFIEVRDDGRGINTEIVYKKALEKGLVDPSRTYSDAEIKEFIMLPGFSTAKVVDNISGRGVGMDVVKTQIFKLGGKVEIQSELGKGSTFVLEVPVNHAIMNGTIIEMNKQHFVVPTVNVKEFLQPNEQQWIFTQQKRTMIKVRDNIIPIVPISTFFKNAKEPEHVPLVMVLELDQELRAIPITNVINRQEVVVKPVGSEFADLKYISGMSILGTGKVSLILDIDYLFKKEVE